MPRIRAYSRNDGGKDNEKDYCNDSHDYFC